MATGICCKMLIHGARAALPTLSKSETPLGGWLRGLTVRARVNTVVVALAAKLADHLRGAQDRAEIRDAGGDGVVANGIGRLRSPSAGG